MSKNLKDTFANPEVNADWSSRLTQAAEKVNKRKKSGLKLKMNNACGDCGDDCSV